MSSRYVTTSRLTLAALILALPGWAAGQIAGVTSTGTPGITETVEAIMVRDRTLAIPSGPPRQQKPLLRHPGPRQDDPGAPEVPAWPAALQPGRGLPSEIPYLPQTVGTSFLGMQLADSGFIPPDSMGAVGPTQVLAVSNGRIRVFDKTGVVGGLDTTLNNFFASVGGSTNGTSDPHVRYDRLSGRWFVVAIDIGAPTCPNNVLLAVSSGPTITDTSSFTFFSYVGQAGFFTDYPTLGVDKFALYIGANMFDVAQVNCPAPSSPANTSAWVINKADLLATPTPTLTFTAFPNLVNHGTSVGIWTPQGVDDDDPAATEGYFIGVDFFLFSRLGILRISDPGGTPTMSSLLTVNVPTTTLPMSQPQPAPGPVLDALDDRLFAAMIKRNKNTNVPTLWTAHNIEVDLSGIGNTAGNRNGSRWYEIGDLATSPTLLQSGTLFDPAVTTPFGYWIPSVAASGQGHMALGASRASTDAVDGFAGIAVAGRLRTDPLGTTQAPTLAQSSSNLYNQSGGPPERWGDYSQVVVDPTDDQTMWTFQEYANATNSWGVRVIKLVAPPPAMPAIATPPTVAAGQPSVMVTIDGTSTAGSEFFDPGPDTGGPGFANHLVAAITQGVTVNGVFSVSPTQVVLDISTTSATNGAADVTITNPDGQSLTGLGLITITASANQPPTISDIPDQTTPINIPVGPIGFTVGDPDSPVVSLTLSGTSADPALVPDGNIVFGGSGASRTVTVTPVAGMVGSTTITVSVSDGVLTANDTFLVSVVTVGVTSIALDVDPTGNGVLEPGETVTVAPTWQNTTGPTVGIMGTAAGLTGPSGATYTLVDPTADYGTLAFGAMASCIAAANCYTVSVSTPVARPAVHWDLTFTETLSTGQTKTWTLHVGDSFTDVPLTHPFYRFVETLLHVGVTAGCTAQGYCPDASTTREQMAVFLLRAREGGAYTPPPCTTPPFADVPCSSPFAPWIKELVARGITAGCGGGLYCPTNPVTRGQMAVFLTITFTLRLYGP